MSSHPTTNPTVAELRCSLGLSRSNLCPPLASNVQNQTAPTSPRPLELDRLLEHEIRSQFSGDGRVPDLLEEFRCVFSLAGKTSPPDLLETVHAIIVERDFLFTPSLERIARRSLSQGKLERLQEAIEQLSSCGSPTRSEDSLAIVSTMVSEKTVWGLVAELRDLLLDIVTPKCELDLLDKAADVLNPNLITQMVSQAAYTPTQFMSTLDAVQQLIERAAPMSMLRFDYWYMPVRAQLMSGMMGAPEDFPFLGMELLETLQDLKLELANWRLSVQRPEIARVGAAWEALVAAKSVHELDTVCSTVNAIRMAMVKEQAENQSLTCVSLHARLMCMLLTDPAPPPMPEVFALDRFKIVHWRDQLRMICLATALWTVGQQILKEHGVEVRPSLILEIRCGMFDSSIQSSSSEHRAWALTFFHWLHAAAADQSKALPIDSSGCRLSSQLIAAAEPSGPIRQLLDSRLLKILSTKPGLGHTTLAEPEQLKLAQCFAVASTELSDVLDSASAVARHLQDMYLPMYAPVVARKDTLSALPPLQRWMAAMLEAPTTAPANPELEAEDDENECEQLEQPGTFELSLPGLKPLSYKRAAPTKRSASTGSLANLVRQSSCGEEVSSGDPPTVQRQSTLELQSDFD